MADLGETVPACEIALELFDRTILDQWHHPATLHAHEMIVMAAGIEQLEVA